MSPFRTGSVLVAAQAKMQGVSTQQTTAVTSRNSSPHSTEALARPVDEDMKSLVLQVWG